MDIILTDLFENLLHILARNPEKNYSLEELAKIVIPFSNDFCETGSSIFIDRKHYSTILDALILLKDKGLVNLNCNSDESSISPNGLMEINKRVFFN